jgi:hypothetical protein
MKFEEMSKRGIEFGGKRKGLFKSSGAKVKGRQGQKNSAAAFW